MELRTHVNGKDMLSVVQEVHSDQATSDLLVAGQFAAAGPGRGLDDVLWLFGRWHATTAAQTDPLKHLQWPLSSATTRSLAVKQTKDSHLISIFNYIQ